jgi:hypothetical protein
MYPEYLVIPPSQVTEQDVVRVTKGMAWEKIEQQARDLGWAVYSGKGTAYDPIIGLQLDLVRANTGTYLLFFPPRGDELMAILQKPRQGGSARTVCSFRRLDR